MIKQRPGVIEPVDGWDKSRIFDALIPENLSDPMPVFLFGIGVVVFVGGPPPGEADGALAFGQITKQVMIKEFPPVIGVEAEDEERQFVLDLLEGFPDSFITFIPYRPVQGPTAENIRHSKGPDEVALNRISAMSHGVGVQKPLPIHIGVIGLDGNLTLQPSTGTGSTTTSTAINSPGGF